MGSGIQGAFTCPFNSTSPLLPESFLQGMGGTLEFGKCGGSQYGPLADRPGTARLGVDSSLLRVSSAGDMPRSLPGFLVARCGDPASWIYSDQKCDGTNNCGDCSDELSPGGTLGTGWAEQWLGGSQKAEADWGSQGLLAAAHFCLAAAA